MFFFTDALDGRTVTVTPEAASVVFDKNVRTGIASEGSALTVSLSWTGGVDYDAVALVLKDATSWRIEPTGRSEQTGTLMASARQNVFQEFDITGGTGIEVVLSNGATLQEVYLLKEYLEITSVIRPMRYRNFAKDPGRREYRTEDQSLISYAGLAPRGKAEILVGWDYLPKVELDKLRDLHFGPPLRKRFLFYPEPVEYPGEVYRVYWQSDFDPSPSASSIASGYTLNCLLLET